MPAKPTSARCHPNPVNQHPVARRLRGASCCLLSQLPPVPRWSAAGLMLRPALLVAAAPRDATDPVASAAEHPHLHAHGRCIRFACRCVVLARCVNPDACVGHPRHGGVGIKPPINPRQSSRTTAPVLQQEKGRAERRKIDTTLRCAGSCMVR